MKTKLQLKEVPSNIDSREKLGYQRSQVTSRNTVTPPKSSRHSQGTPHQSDQLVQFNPVWINNSVNHLQFHFSEKPDFELLRAQVQQYQAQFQEFMDSIDEQKDHVNKHIQMMQQNKSDMMQRLTNLSKRKDLTREVQEIEEVVLSNVEYVENIVKAILRFKPTLPRKQADQSPLQLQVLKDTIQYQQQKIHTMEMASQLTQQQSSPYASLSTERIRSQGQRLSPKRDRCQSKSPISGTMRQEEFNSYWRDQYTDIYQKWDSQNRLISKLRTQIEQLSRGVVTGNERSSKDEIQRLREFNKKLREYQKLQDSEIDVIKQQLERQKEEKERQINEYRNLCIQKDAQIKEFSETGKQSKGLENELQSLRQSLSQYDKIYQENNYFNMQIEEYQKLQKKQEEEMGFLRQQFIIHKEKYEDQLQQRNESMDVLDKRILDLVQKLQDRDGEIRLMETTHQDLTAIQKKHFDEQIQSLNQVINAQEQDIERLNEELSKKDLRIQIITEEENQQSLDRIRRASKMISTVQTPSKRVSNVVSFSEALEQITKPRRHFSLSGKLALLSLRRTTKRQDTIIEVEEENERKPPIEHKHPMISVSAASDGPQDLVLELQQQLKQMQEERENLLRNMEVFQDRLNLQRDRYESQIIELQGQQAVMNSLIPQQSLSDSSDNDSNIELQQQLESCHQEIESLSQALSSRERQSKDLKEENEQLQRQLQLGRELAAQQRELKNMMAEEIRSRVGLQYENEQEREFVQSASISSEDYEVRKLEQRMKGNIKKMVQMKGKLEKLKNSLEGYGEKLGIFEGRRKTSFSIQVSAEDQQEEITMLIAEFLSAMDQMNQIQRQIEYDYDARIQRENERQRQLVSQNIQLKQQLRQSQTFQEQFEQSQRRVQELDQELKKVRVDNVNLQELLGKKGVGRMSEFLTPQQLSAIKNSADDTQLRQARSSTITYDDGKEKEQQMVNKDKEIQLLKKELKDAQDMISILSSQIRSKSTQDMSLSVPSAQSFGRVSMLGQIIEGDNKNLNDKQIGYLTRRVGDLQKKLDLKQGELLQEQNRARQVRSEFEEIFASLEEEVRIRDQQIQDLHEELAKYQAE